MSFFSDIKKRLHGYYLNKELQKQTSKRNSVNFDKAKTIGILYEGGNVDKQKIISKYIQSLEKKGKSVKPLMYMDDNRDHPSSVHKYFSKKDLDWRLIPKSSDVKDFINKPFDILIDLHTGKHSPLEYIAATSKAHLRVGPVTDKTYCYDLMIDTTDKGDLNHFIGQVDYFLKIFNNQPHDATV